MEKADDSDGFDSCEEINEIDPNKRTGNPFQDFALDLKEIPDQETQLTLKIARKMIVDWIEAGKDVDLEGWVPVPLKNYKKDKIQAFSGTS
jgi:hypothetical protein